MLLFIALSLGLCFIEQSATALPAILVSPFFVYAGLTIALASIVGLFFEKLPENMACDSFSSGTLLLWFAYWKPEFNGDSPIFFFFPLYFALMSAFISLFLTNQNHRIDKTSLLYMQHLNQERLMPSWSVMLCVLVSLELQQHYLLYPVLMTLLMLRCAFSSCLEDLT